MKTMDVKEVVSKMQEMLLSGNVKIRKPVKYPAVDYDFTVKELKARVAGFERDCINPAIDELSRRHLND